MTEIPTMDKRVLKIDQEPKAPALPADDPLDSLPANEKETLASGEVREKMFSMDQYNEDGTKTIPYKFTIRSLTQQVSNLQAKAADITPGAEPTRGGYDDGRTGDDAFNAAHGAWDRDTNRKTFLTAHAATLNSALTEAKKKS